MTDPISSAVETVSPSLKLAAVAIVKGISDPDELRAALDRARVVGVLDAWRATGNYRRTWTMGRNCCVLHEHDFATGELINEHVYDSSNPDAARAAAAKAIENGEFQS